MMMERATLGEICDAVGGTVQTGPFGSQLHDSDYTEHGVPVVMPRDIVRGRIDESVIARVPEDTAQRLDRHRLAVGDIVYGRRGDIGRRALISAAQGGYLCGTGCLRVSLGASSSLLEPSFLYYYLGAPEVTAGIAAKAVGATMLNLNTNILREVEIQYPPLLTQRRIASILSAYDDLIENDTKRIQILEEMARALYREWFVHFRFPGHEKVKFVDSPLGEIPEGWEVGRFDDALVLQRGFDLPTDCRVAGPVPIYASTGVVGTHHEGRVTGPAVVTGRSGSLGTVRLVEGDFWPLNTALWSRELKRVSAHFAYFLLQELDLARMGGGAAVPTLNRNHVHGMEIVIPHPRAVSQFDDMVVPMFKLSAVLRQRRDVLRQTRDLLLPRLISGEIDVDNLDLPEAP